MELLAYLGEWTSISHLPFGRARKYRLVQQYAKDGLLRIKVIRNEYNQPIMLARRTPAGYRAFMHWQKRQTLRVAAQLAVQKAGL